MSPARFLRPSRRGSAVVAIFFCALPLGACGELAAGAEDTRGPPAARSAAPAAPAISSDLLPAPDVFEASGTARWDGRRTLQGVWVAHPQASTARRVRIYNAATGAAADGALFTRDPVLSGPSMLVSSDAAGLLGLAPGEEADLRVVALTPRSAGDVEVLAAASAAARVDAPAAAAPGAERPPAATSARAVASAAPGGTEEGTAAGVAARTLPAPSVGVASRSRDTARPVGSAANRVAETRAVADPRRSDSQPAAATPAVAGARQAAPAAAQSEVAQSEIELEPGTGSESPVREPAKPAVAAPGPAAGAPEADVARPAAAKDATADAAPASAQTPAPGTLAQPYVQAGLFAVEDNAERLIRRIRDEGLPAVGEAVRLATGPATRVLAGPFATAAERDAARRRIQAMGLRDAVPVAQ
jgi:cell division septation protein DedD